MAISAPSDYSAASLNVTFSAEDTERTVTLQTMADDILEPTAEDFFVYLTLPADQNGFALGRDTATVSITDDDSKLCKISNWASVEKYVSLLLAVTIRVSARTFTVHEPSGFVNVTFEREGEISDRISVVISTLSGTAEGITSHRTTTSCEYIYL